ncbi:hypothetical protein K523DRAFT_256760 [Schizophyllum commune Tattone D]|nr:hypothetical protein K523DRAFT_256760 [Schizophyllum commune Tattone D]
MTSPTLATLSSPPASENDRRRACIRILELQSHQDRLNLQEEIRSGKGTGEAYDRWITEYIDFTYTDQLQRLEADENWAIVHAHPITGTKVAIFLRYLISRCTRTRGGQEIPGTRLGVSSVKQAISALEYCRINNEHQDCYKEDPESLRKLREDQRVRMYEKAAAANEPQRLKDAEATKADGTSADTYTAEEYRRLAIRMLIDGGATKRSFGSSLRDRCMFLLGGSMAFRGDNTRDILLSDLVYRDVAIPDLGPGVTVPVCPSSCIRHS